MATLANLGTRVEKFDSLNVIVAVQHDLVPHRPGNLNEKPMFLYPAPQPRPCRKDVALGGLSGMG